MFKKTPLLIGAVHLQPLPGAAGYCGSVQEIVEQALIDAKAYLESGFDGLILENMHDAPYLKGFVHPETVASMTVVAGAVKEFFQGPLGVQLLAGANLESLAVANALKWKDLYTLMWLMKAFMKLVRLSLFAGALICGPIA